MNEDVDFSYGIVFTCTPVRVEGQRSYPFNNLLAPEEIL